VANSHYYTHRYTLPHNLKTKKADDGNELSIKFFYKSDGGDLRIEIEPIIITIGAEEDFSETELYVLLAGIGLGGFFVVMIRLYLKRDAEDSNLNAKERETKKTWMSIGINGYGGGRGGGGGRAKRAPRRRSLARRCR
jgi:hypothetical protein